MPAFRKRTMDDIDRAIVYLIQQKPTISESEISKRVALSQPAVGARIKRLKNSGLLEVKAGLSAHFLRYRMAIVLARTKNTREVLETFKVCPRTVLAMETVGTYNVILQLVAKRDRMIEAIIEETLVRRLGVVDSYVAFGMVPQCEGFIPAKIVLEKGGLAPCGMDCTRCPRYVDESCSGCPATRAYREEMELE